jgi:serine/threonine-protein kinase
MPRDHLPCFGDRYVVLRVLGSGGMGRVYLAQDTRHSRQVAIKVLDPEYARALGTQRFVREIQIAARLTHPSIVPVHDSGDFDGQLFYVMPYIEGESLRQRLDRETMLPLEQTLTWADEVCGALAFAHERGVVHRDIKPENLLIQGEHILLADFGIARAIDLAAGETLTSTQVVLGTPQYMSPEQATGARLDSRTDVYSLACVVYEMLAGEPPYAGGTPQALTAKKMSGRYPPIRVVRPNVPRSVDKALAGALAVIPADRPATAGEFARRLRLPDHSGRKRLGILIGGLGLSALVLWAGARRLYPPQAERPHPRVVVETFDNRTGDPGHDPLGFMTSDWITEGLHRSGAVDVVPTATMLAAVRGIRASGDSVDPVKALALETGATLVLTGAIYRDQDSLVFQAQLADPSAGRLVGAVEPLRVSEEHAGQGVSQLRERLMGLLALKGDDRILGAEQPPTFAAYKAFSEGLNAYVRNDNESALASFLMAYEADTSFILPLLYASFCQVNRRERASADSLLAIVARGRQRLNEYDRSWLDYQRAELAGNDSEALAAIRRAAELAPASKATYNFAATAYEARLPFAAESALSRLSPDAGPMRGWWPYWEILTSALHAQGKHRQELAAAREAARRFPGRPDGVLAEARALAARHDWAGLERLWQDTAARSKRAAPERTTLAYEIASEVAAHGDSSRAHQWFERASSDTASESRWPAAQAAARLGRLGDAVRLGEALAAEDTARKEDYLGFLGVLAARSGNEARARELLERLAADKREYTLGVPQFEAGRVAALLGEQERAGELFVFALDRGYPYMIEFHRDEALRFIRKLPVFPQLDVREQ